MATSQSPNCVICIEAFTKSIRTPILCSACEFECCKACFKRYVSSPEHPLRCMQCSHEFDRFSLYKRLGRSFIVNTYKLLRQNILYEQEKALFGATQPIVERDLEVVRTRLAIDEHRTRFVAQERQNAIEMEAFKTSVTEMPINVVFQRYQRMKTEHRILLQNMSDEIRNLWRSIHDIQSSPLAVQRIYTMTCTYGNCKGLLSNELKNDKGNYVCSICTQITCATCELSIDTESHICDEDDVATLKVISESTKQCPSCAAHIHRVSGCSQMFCTNCNCTFDWETLRINNGSIHNPHHAEWLRHNRNRHREIGDVQCGREPTLSWVSNIHAKIERSFEREYRGETSPEATIARNSIKYLQKALNTSVRHHTITIPALAGDGQPHMATQSLRVQLLKNAISDVEFKEAIYRKYQTQSKHAEFLQVIQTYRDAIADIVAPFAEDNKLKPFAKWTSMVQEIIKLELYLNDALYDIASAYGSNHRNSIMQTNKFK